MLPNYFPIVLKQLQSYQIIQQNSSENLKEYILQYKIYLQNIRRFIDKIYPYVIYFQINCNINLKITRPTAVYDQKFILYTAYIIFIMGGICPIFGSTIKQQPKPNTHRQQIQKGQTDRTLHPKQNPTNDDHQPELTATDKKNILNDSMHSNTAGKLDKMLKNGNTTLSSSVLQRKNSSLLFQGGIFDSSSIIIKNCKDNSPKLAKQNQNCYVLIDNVFLVKKSMDCIKVISPHSQSQLNCAINNIASTYYLTQGLPLDTIKQLPTRKIIQISQSPIITKIKLVCKNCLEIFEKQKNKQNGQKSSNASQNVTIKPRQIKMTFSTSLIHLKQVVCDECQHKGQWRLLSIRSNYPIWGNGHKIYGSQVIENVPSTIRIMGCISCLRYTDSQMLPCGCYMCKNCYQQNQTKQCKLCEAAY